MIIDKEIKIRLNSHNIKYYRNLGYNKNPLDYIIIPIEHLSRGSNYKLNVKCDICGSEKLLIYNKYLKNVENGGYYSCSNKCSVLKYENHCINKYGVKNTFQLEEVKDRSKKTKIIRYNDENYNNVKKNQETCISKYGFKSYSQTKDHFIKMNYILDDELDDWNLYKRKSRRLFNKIKKNIISNWNGYDYYDGEYIKDNLNLKYTDKNYPTIDHVISVYDGFKNNIPVEEINSESNLVVTKRVINSIKGYKKTHPFQ